MPLSKARFRLRTLLVGIAILAPILVMLIHAYRMGRAFDDYYFPKGRPTRQAAPIRGGRP
jgi:hypothetical protein